MTTIGWRVVGEGVEQLVGDPQRDEDQPVAVAAVEVAEEAELIGGIGAVGGDDEAVARQCRARR